MKKQVEIMFHDGSDAKFDNIRDHELNDDDIVINMAFVAYYKVIY